MAPTALDLVMLLSRWFGLAPYVRAPDYNVSRNIDVCGKIIIISIWIYTTVTMVYFMVTFEGNTFVFGDYVQSAARFGAGTIALIGTFTSSERIGRMFRTLKQLDRINSNITRKNEADRNIFLSVLLFLVFTALTRFGLFTYHSYVVGNIPLLQLARVLQYQMINLLQMQLVTFADRILETVERLNVGLEQLIPDKSSMYKNKNKVRIAWQTTEILSPETQGKNDESTIRQLAKHYLSICEIIRRTTVADGTLLVLLLASQMLHIEYCLHKIVIWYSNDAGGSFYFIGPSIAICITQAVALVFFNETFHLTHAQMDRTRVIIKHLKCHRGDEEEMNNELELFTRLLMLNQIKYSPLSMCTLSRSLVFKIFGCVVTYLVIILTYGPETKAPSLALNNKQSYL